MYLSRQVMLQLHLSDQAFYRLLGCNLYWRFDSILGIGMQVERWRDADIILCMHSANERRHYIVPSSFIGWVHTQNEPRDGGPALIKTGNTWHRTCVPSCQDRPLYSSAPSDQTLKQKCHFEEIFLIDFANNCRLASFRYSQLLRKFQDYNILITLGKKMDEFLVCKVIHSLVYTILRN